MASYLAMVMIGKYRVTTGTWHGLPMVLAVSADADTINDVLLARTPEMLDFLVTQFGPYPFDAVGGIIQDDIGLGYELENQTRPVYGPNPEPTIVVHELAHQWYGDDVSVARWSDVWLNEGFATYAEWLWTEHEGGESARDKFDSEYSGLVFGPPAAPADARAAFGRATYVRGAMTLQALRMAVGDATFFKILRGWPVARRFGNATTVDFIAYADKVSGRSLDSFLRRWLYEPGRPPYPKPVPRP